MLRRALEAQDAEESWTDEERRALSAHIEDPKCPQIALRNFSGFSQEDGTLIQREIYEFGPYSLDSAQTLLRRAGNVVQLQPRALETLLVLVRRRGEVVSKQELMDSVWPDSFVEEGNLTQNIFLLRRELGKTPEGEEYIQTLPKRGYRMNMPVSHSIRSIGTSRNYGLPQRAQPPSALWTTKRN